MVEDEESITEPLAEALEREGFDTRVAGTVEAALERGAARAAGPRAARRDAAGRLGLRRLPRAAPELRGADHHAHRARGGDRPRGGPRARGRRLRGQAVQRPRGRGADPRGAAAQRGRPARSQRAARGRRAAARPGPAQRDARRRRARPHAARVRAARAADARGRLGGHARAAHRRGLGRELVRLDEDPRRARVEPAPEAGRGLRRARASSTPCAGWASASRGRTSSGTVSPGEPQGAAARRVRLRAGAGDRGAGGAAGAQPLPPGGRRDQERGTGPGRAAGGHRGGTARRPRGAPPDPRARRRRPATAG